MLLCTFPMLLCLFPMMLCTFPLPQRRRSPSGNFSAQTSASLHPSAALPPAASAGCPYQQLRHGAPASNKPHPAENSTPVWLAIWRTWAGFANSQLRRAAFLSLYLYICAYPRYCNLGAAAQTDANLSAHLHRLPTPPPYLRHMRLLPGWGAGVWGWIWLSPVLG